MLTKLLHGAERHRAYFYRLALAVGGLLVVLGRVTSGDVAAVMTVVGALLGLGGSGLASANTSTRKPNEDGAVEPGSLALGIVIGLVLVWLLLR